MRDRDQTRAASAAADLLQATPAVSTAALRRLCLVFLITGVAWRLLRYVLQFPIWGDEAFVCLNFLDRNYGSIIGPLECGQVAPLFFLWGELTFFKTLGSSELAVRLFPLLAGLGGMLLFARLAWRLVSPVAATLAVGFLAVAYWPVAMSSTVKPYSLDLFMALALLIPAVEWLQKPGQRCWLAWLCLLCPLAIFSSYPAVCVAGGVSLALLPTIWQRREGKSIALFATYNIGLLTAFVVHFGLVASRQLAPEAGRLENYLQTYWADGFPPAGLWAFGEWAVRIHTGRMCAYPVGASDGGSTATTLLVLAGLWQLFGVMQRRSPDSGESSEAFHRSLTLPARLGVRLLLLAPFGLNFIAAMMHKYPYGGCCRLSQHLAPAICLLAGAGLAGVIEWVAGTPRRQVRLLYLAAAGLIVIPAIGMVRDLAWPYKDLQSQQVRTAIQTLFEHAPADEPIVVLDAQTDVDPVHRWHLSQHLERVHWNGQIAPALKAQKVWTINFRLAPTTDPEATHFGQHGIMYADIQPALYQNGRLVASPPIDMAHRTHDGQPDQRQTH